MAAAGYLPAASAALSGVMKLTYFIAKPKQVRGNQSSTWQNT